MTRKAADVQELPPITKKLIDQFVNGPKSAEAVNATSMAFTQARTEQALGAELTQHLGFAPGEDKPPPRPAITAMAQLARPS